jgi:diaminopimelate epimerase
MQDLKAQQVFTKMHGLGNDFIVIDDFKKAPSQGSLINATLVRRLCDRHRGVGADQLLWIKNPKNKQALARMDIFNADGSKAEMCGNGIRAVALYLADHYLKGNSKKKIEMKIETAAGLIALNIKKADQKSNRQVEVALAIPKLGRGFLKEEILSSLNQTFSFFEVHVGNPHAVFFVKQVNQVPLEKWGPALERHRAFPHHTNVEFVEVLDAHSIKVRVWERGAGITLACGTGACAAAVAAIATARVKNSIKVYLPGGVLKVRWEKGVGEKVFMEGPAVEVFRGKI